MNRPQVCAATAFLPRTVSGYGPHATPQDVLNNGRLLQHVCFAQPTATGSRLWANILIQHVCHRQSWRLGNTTGGGRRGAGLLQPGSIPRTGENVNEIKHDTESGYFRSVGRPGPLRGQEQRRPRLGRAWSWPRSPRCVALSPARCLVRGRQALFQPEAWLPVQEIRRGRLGFASSLAALGQERKGIASRDSAGE